MTNNQQMITNDLIAAEQDWSSPAFQWNNATYPCMPSIDTLVLKLQKGLSLVKSLTLTVRLYNADGSFVFPSNTLPESIIDTVTYEGEDYTIQEVTNNISRAFIEMLCVSATRDE